MPLAEESPLPSEPQADLITLFVAPLNRLGLLYMVTGAVAAIVYGEPRLTNDIDLVLDLSARDVGRLARTFASDAFYCPPSEVMAAEIGRPLGGHFNLIHLATALKADIYVAGTDPLHRWALERRRPIAVSNEEVWIAPPEYVVLRKLEYFRDSGSDRHLRDIRAMLRELGRDIDLAGLIADIQRLGLVEQWEAVGKDPA